MYCPSGDQVGLFTNHRRSREICFASLPSAAIVQMFHKPSRSEENAMRLPSGLNFGCMSKTGPLVSRVAADVPPSIGEADLRERALAEESVIRALAGREIAKVIVRAPKLVSIVVR